MGRLTEKIKSEKAVLAICFWLALMVWGVFGQTLRHEFVNYDDPWYVYDNPAISKGVTPEGVRWVVTHPHGANWHPLTSLSHMLDVQLYGMNPGGHHRTNVLLHMATVILLFLVLRQMTGSLWRSAFVAAVFAIHPLRVESVAWISERKDVLSGLFFMLTLGAYTRYARVAGGGWRVTSRRYLAVVLFFVLGLISKAMLVTLPFVLLLLDYWPLGRFGGRRTEDRRRKTEGGKTHQSTPINYQPFLRLIIEKIPLLALSAVFCGVTVWAQQQTIIDVKALPFPWRFGNALCAYAVYIKQMLFPYGLAPLYPHQETGLPLWGIGLSLVVLTGISLAVLAGHKKRPYLLTGWLWYLGMLVPVIGIMQVGAQSHADRYTYLPQIGLAVMLTWAVADGCAALRYRRAVLSAAAAAILSVLAIAAHGQTRHWRDSISIWTLTLAHTERNAIAHNNLGNFLEKQGQTEAAIEHFQQALQINPWLAEAHNNLGLALTAQGKTEAAIEHYQQALQINPRYAEAHNNLGFVLAEQGGTDAAIEHFQQALQINPRHALAHNNLGLALAAQGKTEAAIEHFQQSLKINPQYVEVKNNLAWVLATCPDAALRNGPLAVELATAADRSSGGTNASVLDTLAAAYAEAGRYPEAVAAARRALDAAAGQESAAEELRMRLHLYEKKMPYHEK
jgi:protein O-mannosyl-transferase